MGGQNFEKWSELEFGQNRFFKKNEKFSPINFPRPKTCQITRIWGPLAICAVGTHFLSKVQKMRFLTKKIFFEKTRFLGPNARNFPLVTPDVFGQFFRPVLGLQKTGFDAKIDRVLFARSTPKNRLFRKMSKTRVGTRQKMVRKIGPKKWVPKKVFENGFQHRQI